MNWYDWPKCAVPACENRCCLRLHSKYCWPHTTGTPSEVADNLFATEPSRAIESSISSIGDSDANTATKP